MTRCQTKNQAAFGRRASGFTLIELMIVVAVVAILASIAIPSYDEYIRRTHRSNARSAMLQLAQWMERAATAQGLYPAAAPAALLEVEGERYALALESPFGGAAAGTAYRITATPAGGQTGDQCGNFRLTHTGVRTVTGTLPVDECWGR